MGGKSKRRKTKRAEGSGSQGPQSPAKQSLKKERTKTRDAKLHRVGDGGEEEEEGVDTVTTMPNKVCAPSQHATKTLSQEEEKSSYAQDENTKSAAVKSDTIAVDKTHNLPQTELEDSSEITNIIEDSTPTQHSQVNLTDLNKDCSLATPEELQMITSEESLKEELREATEEEYPPVEEPQSEIICNVQNTVTRNPVKKITFQKSTQTDPVHITCIEKPVKFFISDDSDSDTAIFVDASQGASNGIYGRTYGNIETYSLNKDTICTETDDTYGSGIKTTTEGPGVKPSTQNDSEPYTEINNDTESIDVLDNGNSCTTHSESEMHKSENLSIEQKTRYWQHMSHSEDSHTQEVELRNGKMTFSYDSFSDQDDLKHSFDTSDKLSRSFSDIGDQVDINMSSVNEMTKDKEKKLLSEDPLYLNSPNPKSLGESVNKDADHKSFDGGVTSKASHDHDKKTLNDSSNRRLTNKNSSLESVEADSLSRTSLNEYEEQKTQDENLYRKYESADGIAKIFAADSGDPESTNRSSISECGHFYSTNRISAQDSVDESNKISPSATGSSFSVSGDYTPSKSSICNSSEFDVESLPSTTDHLTSKEGTLNDLNAKQKVRELEEGGEESPTETKYEHEANRPSTSAWEELSLEDQVQFKKEGIYRIPLRNDKSEIEADAESLFFSLYPEYSPGEHDELQDVTSSEKKDNPNVLCFRGQAARRDENEEEVYMATEKSKEFKIREGRNKGPGTGKAHEFQQKLAKQKKSKRKTKEINEYEGFGQQECGSNTKEQPNPSMQRPQRDSSASTRWETSFSVYDSSSNFTTIDSKEAKHPLCTETDNMVCQSRQLGKQLQKSASGADFATETTADKVYIEENPYEVVESPTSPTEVAEEVFEVENKIESNSKDRKTFVGIAKDWIKGVTGLGIRRDDAIDKINEKDEGKTDMDFKAESGSSQYSDKTQIKGRNNFEDTKETDNLKTFKGTVTAQTRGYQKRERMICIRGTDSDIKDEGLFEPDDDLSDSVFRDVSWKGRNSDDNDVQDTKTGDSWVGSQDDEFMFEMIDSVQEQETNNTEETSQNEKAKKADRNRDLALHGKADKSLFKKQSNNVNQSKQDTKQRKTSEGEEFREQYQHGELKAPSLYKEDKKEETGKRPLQRDREGRGGSRKRRQRRRTKSYEDSVDDLASGKKETDTERTSRELRPEEVALPNDGFENETTEQMNTAMNFEQHDEGKTHNGAKASSESKRSFRKSCKDKQHARNNDTKTEFNEQNSYEKSERDELIEMKEEEQEIEKLDEDTYQISEDIKSPPEKNPKQKKVQSPFTAPAATWSPCVGRREWKGNKKSYGNAQEIQSINDSETFEEVKDEFNHEDVLDQTLEMQLSKSKSRQPGLSLTVTKIREDTPIPSHKTTHCDFEEHSAQNPKIQEITCDQRPLLQALTFPPGVSMPLSPVHTLEELKFPLGISKPISPVPGPKFVPGFTCKLTSPCLGFQEAYFKATSPVPEKKSQSDPSSVSSSNAHEAQPYPARPVSPLKELVFPEGISRPLSPQPRKPQISGFSTPYASPKITSVLSCSEYMYDSLDSPTIKSDYEESPPSSPKLRKERPQLIIPEPESPTAQVMSSPKLVNTTSLTEEFPEGNSRSLSPSAMASQLSGDTQIIENKIYSEHIQPPENSSNMDPMKLLAKPVPPLRSIAFPEGISEPISPDPKKVFLWPSRPSLSNLMSQNLKIGYNVVCESDESQTEIPVAKESSSLDSQNSGSHQILLKEFTFPEGISIPVSPKKSYFSNIFIKMTQPSTRLVSPSNNIYFSPSVSEDLSSITNESTELKNKGIQSSPTPNSLSESDYTNETPSSQHKTETTGFDDLIASENNKLNTPVTTQSSPSMALLSVYSPDIRSDSQPSEHKEFLELPMSEAVPCEEYTTTVSSHYILTSNPKTPEVFTSTSPMPIEPKVSDLTASSPLIIKQSIDFPSDAFPCTLASLALVKSISTAAETASIPSPRLNLPSTKSKLTDLEISLPESAEPQIITEPTESNPFSQNTINGCEVKETHPDLQETKNEPEVPPSTSTEFTNLKEIDAAEFHTFPNSSSVNKEDSEKAEISLVSENDNSLTSQATTMTTISPTQTSSEVSQEITPSGFPDDNKEQTHELSSPSLMPEHEPPLSRMDSPRDKSSKKSAMIHTSEVRLAARYSRGESPCSRGDSPLQKINQSTTEQSQASKEKTDSTPEILGVRQLRDFHQSAQDALRSSPDMLRSCKEGSNSPKSGSQSPHSGCDSPSKKMKRRKRR